MKLSDIAKQLGSRGGKKSAEVRYRGKSKEEISEIMSKLKKGKLTKKEEKEFTKTVEGMVENLNKNVLISQQRDSKNQPTLEPSE